MMKINAKKLTRILIALWLVGCAREQPYDSLEMPGRQVFSKSVLSEEMDKSLNDDNEFLFLASTLGAPRAVVSQFPHYQGEPKIIKFRFERDGIKGHERDEDDRFAQNSLNEKPIIHIPVEYVDFKCATNNRGDCTNKEVLDAEKDWKEKRYFIPDFDKISLAHLSEIKVFVEDGCFLQISQKAIQNTLSNDVINVEIEREYELKNDINCIMDHFDFKSFAIKNPSFKVRYFYSMVRLSTLVSKNYRPVEYPVTDHHRFGFFKNRIERLEDNFDSSRPQETYYLNRFNPSNGEAPKKLDFHLNAAFNKPENLYLRKATHQAVDNINRALDEARANIQINLVHADPKAQKKHSGDLRYNTIVLIDEPLANGLLGYGPSVANPRTGEILQAHTNMYSGVLKSTVRRTYQAMVRFSRQKLAAKDATTDIRQTQEDQQALLHGTLPLPHSSSKIEPLSAKNIEGKYKNVQAKMKRQLSQSMGPQERKRVKLSRQGMTHQHPAPPSQKMDFHQERMEICAQNNAYHVDMVNFKSLGKELLPGIAEIPGILSNDKTLKPWDQIDQEQRAQVIRIVTKNLYISILVHELGHNLGLRHNFMASTDAKNFYTTEEAQDLGMWSVPAYSSVMDYPASGLNELATFGKYDIAALRFAYGREVELEQSGEMVKVSTTLTDLSQELQRKDKKLRHYQFCTDQNAGLSALCAPFDEGSNVKEIATYYVQLYQDTYSERNWRNGRLDFNTYQLPYYIVRNMRIFRSMRKIHEMFELYASFFGTEFMLQGCSLLQLIQFPEMCMNINNTRDATFIVGNFFLNILKTPDLTCSLSQPLDENNKTVALVSLKKIYDEMRWQTDMRDVPKSCFDPLVQSYLANPSNHFSIPFVVKGEAGKYLNSISEPDPRYPYNSDIRVRGVWSDKILAMRYLTTRIDENVGSNNSRSSLLDLPFISQSLNNFFDHIVAHSPLESPVKFSTANGTEYEENHFELAGGNYQIAENPHPIISYFFGLPEFGQAALNKTLVDNAVWFNQTEDYSINSLAESFNDNLSIFKSRKIIPLDSTEQKSVVLGKHRYIAEEQNRIALILVNAKEAMNQLKETAPELVQRVLKARTTVPKHVDHDTQVVINHFAPVEIEALIEFIASQGENLPPADLSPPPFNSVIILGVAGLERALAIIEQMNTPPEDASAEEKGIYAVVDLKNLREFLSGDLQRRVDNFDLGISLLHSQ